jgi:hypothetical protein
MNYEFDKCLINFESCPKNLSLIEHFTHLSSFSEFSTASDDEIKISICLSDFDSPFLKINDLDSKVKAIFDYLKIDIEKNKKLYKQVLEWQHKKIIDITSVYLQMQSKHDFTRWWTLNRLYYELQKELNQPKAKDDDIDAYIKRKLLLEKNSEDFIEKLQRYEQRLFPDIKMKNAIVFNEMVKIIGYPEKFAQERSVI